MKQGKEQLKEYFNECIKSGVEVGSKTFKDLYVGKLLNHIDVDFAETNRAIILLELVDIFIIENNVSIEKLRNYTVFHTSLKKNNP